MHTCAIWAPALLSTASAAGTAIAFAHAWAGQDLTDGDAAGRVPVQMLEPVG